MPSPKFIVRNSTGGVVFHSDDASFGCVADILDVVAGSTTTYTYPGFAGRTLFALDASTLFSDPTGAYTIDYALGYPRIIFSSRGYDRQVMMFVK